MLLHFSNLVTSDLIIYVAEGQKGVVITPGRTEVFDLWHISFLSLSSLINKIGWTSWFQGQPHTVEKHTQEV